MSLLDSPQPGSSPNRRVPPRGHDVRFYEAPHFPVDTVARYLEGGLEGGLGVLVATTAEHRAALITRLDAGGALARGQLVFLDADEMATLLGPTADAEAFEVNVAARVRGLIDRFGGVRAFGEVVDVFWRRGERDAALRLEERWTALIAERAFDLLCTYSVDTTAGETAAPVLHVRANEEPRAFGDDFDAKQFLAEVAQLLSSTLDYEATLERVVELGVATASGADWCLLDLIDERGDSYVRSAVGHHRSEDGPLARSLRRRYRVMPEAAYGTSQVLLTGRAQLVPDVDAHVVDAIASDETDRASFYAMGIRSLLSAPLVVRRKVIGTITFAARERKLHARDVWFAEQLASLAAVAIENARLFAAESAARAQLVRLQQVTAALSRAQTVSEVAAACCQQGAEATRARSAYVWLVDAEGALRMAGSWGALDAIVERFAVLRPEQRDIPAVESLRTGVASWVESPEAYEAMAPVMYEQARLLDRAASFVSLPLVSKEKVIGVLAITHRPGHRYDADARALCHSVAQQCAQALDRARTFDAERRSNERLALLAGIGEILAQETDARVTLSKVVTALVPFADCGAFLVTEGNALKVAAVEHRDRDCVALADTAARALERSAIGTMDAAPWNGVSKDDAERLGPDAQAALAKLDVGSWLAAPARVGDAISGVLWVARSKDASAFDAADGTFVEEVARRAGVALERTRLFASVRDSARRAETANRLKDELLATVSHELRTPLSAITGWVRLLRSGTVAVDRQSHALEVIERNAHTQEKLIADLLDVSRVMSGGLRLKVEPTEMMKVVAMAIDAMKPTAQLKGVELVATSTIDRRGGVVLGDPERLQQVVWNLITNAVKFTPQNGRVEVGLDIESTNVVLSVKDNGKGIKPEFLPYVFEAFRQAEGGFARTHGGLGLGLTITKTLVEMHGGTIEARSRGLGHGATFAVTLPSAYARSDSMPRVPTLSQKPESTEHRDLENVPILVLEDEPDSRELLLTLFEHCGAKVYGAASVAEAMEKFRHGEPRLIVSDLGLPGDDGLSFIRKLRLLPGGAKVPAIALTAFVRGVDRARALEAGFDAHVPKPVEPDALIAIAAQLVRAARS